MILRDLLRDATQTLKDGGITSAPRDARLLVACAAGIAPDRLTLELGQPVSADVVNVLNTLLERRSAHEPVSRILGKRLFWGRWFSITPDVLDPRGDTETLVALALQHPFHTALDLGTGSGCIAITLAAESAAQVTATDLSEAALRVAEANARSCEVELELLQSDWFQAVTGHFDLIVSNPPYISDDEMAELEPDVLNFDPHLALTPGGDGLDPYREIASHAKGFLTASGRVLVEIGHLQGPAVHALFKAQGFQKVVVHQDFEAKDRVVEAWI